MAVVGSVDMVEARSPVGVDDWLCDSVGSTIFGFVGSICCAPCVDGYVVFHGLVDVSVYTVAYGVFDTSRARGSGANEVSSDVRCDSATTHNLTDVFVTCTLFVASCYADTPSIGVDR